MFVFIGKTGCVLGMTQPHYSTSHFGGLILMLQYHIHRQEVAERPDLFTLCLLTLANLPISIFLQCNQLLLRNEDSPLGE